MGINLSANHIYILNCFFWTLNCFWSLKWFSLASIRLDWIIRNSKTWCHNRYHISLVSILLLVRYSQSHILLIFQELNLRRTTLMNFHLWHWWIQLLSYFLKRLNRTLRTISVYVTHLIWLLELWFYFLLL